MFESLYNYRNTMYQQELNKKNDFKTDLKNDLNNEKKTTFSSKEEYIHNTIEYIIKQQIKFNKIEINKNENNNLWNINVYHD